MAEEGTEEEPSGVPPDDAFAVLGNETRLVIVQALWEAYDPHASDNAVPFSELYNRVGHDDTGNFNYHLGKLTDHFVTQTETGYVLTSIGFRVARAVVAGMIDEQPSVGPTEIDADCPLCDASVETLYADHHLSARCTRCAGLWQGADDQEGYLFKFSFPPAGLADRTPEEAFHATVTTVFTNVRSYRNGVCPTCSGVVEERLDVCASHDPREDGGCPECGRRHMSEVSTVCTQCKGWSRGPLTIAILLNPIVTEFYREHGIDIEFESWESFKRGQTIHEELLGTDPIRVQVTVPCEDDRLRITFDETLAVVDADR